MSAIEIAVQKLGAYIVRRAASNWLGVDHLAASTSLSSLVSGRISDRRQQRQLARELENLVDVLADRLAHTAGEIGLELPENERAAAVQAVVDTLTIADLSENDLVTFAMNPAGLQRHLAGSRAKVLRGALLSEPAEHLYSVLLDQACTAIVELATQLPQWSSGASAILLSRLKEQTSRLDTLLARLPEATDPQERFEDSYRRLVASSMDTIELYGVHLPERMRSLRLTDTYTPLTVSADGHKQLAHLVVADHRRVHLLGTAGSGKTTLLAWLAVSVANRSCIGPISPLNEMLPVYVPLRRLAEQPLRRPQDIVTIVSPTLPEASQAETLTRRLRDGTAIVLVDGLDEIPPSRRSYVLLWLSDLVNEYPSVRYVVTSRPSVPPFDSLTHLGFETAELLPLDIVGMSTLVRHWFHAVSETPEDASAQARMMVREIDEQPELAGLAGTPLLCMLICATFLTRRKMPLRRTELYSMFVETLLDRRDTHREIFFDEPLGRTEKMSLLQKLAWWLVEHDQTEVDVPTATSVIKTTSRHLIHVSEDASTLYRHLLERSGLLQEPAPGQVRFIHQTFQEFFAAKEAAEADLIDRLIAVAHRESWHDVVTLTAGQCYASQADHLIDGLLSRSKAEPQHRRLLLRTVEKCLDTAARVHPDLRAKATAALTQANADPRQNVDSAVYQLVDSLLTLRCMRDESGRRAVVKLLPDGIQHNIAFTSNSRSHVLHIVRACLDHANGLNDLANIVRALDGDSSGVHRFENLVREVADVIHP